MKTLHIFHHGDLKNGVDKTTCTLIKALKAKGVTTMAVVPRKGDVTAYLEKNNVPYFIVPFSCCDSHTDRAQLRFFADCIDQQATLETIIKDFLPNVVHLNTGHLLHAGLAAASCRVPCIWHIHAPFAEDLARYQSTIGEGGYRWLLNTLSSQIIGVSEDVSHSLAPLFPQERIKTLYNGIDVDELVLDATASTTDIRRSLGLVHDAKLILGIGRISAQKDFAAFARVAAGVLAQRSDVYFVIAGPKQESQAIELLHAEIERLQLNNRLFILGPRSDVPALIRQADAYLSTAIFEGHPIATMEVMALKTPVVAMACKGLRECLQHEQDGLLVDPGNESGAATALLRLLDDQSLAMALSEKGQQSVIRKFSSQQYAEHFLTIARAAMEFGPAKITSDETSLINGLLIQIQFADHRLATIEQKTLWEHVRWLLWKLTQRLKS